MVTSPEFRKIFLASPGDLEGIRKTFRDVVHHYNTTSGPHRPVHFEPVGWEYTVPGTGRPQELVNEDVRQCHYFLLVLYTRWGTQPVSFGGNYSSGSEEEFYEAMAALKDPQLPMRQVAVLFRSPPPTQLADPGPQLTKVLAFRQKIEAERSHLFHVFDTEVDFQQILNRLLYAWERSHQATQTEVPFASRVSIRLERTAPNRELDEADRLTSAGRLLEAEALYTKAVIRGGDPDALDRYGRFLHRQGRTAAAEVTYQRLLELSGETLGEWAVKALRGLGNVALERSDLQAAEDAYSRCLDLAQQLGLEEIIASAQNNLGVVAYRRGDLAEAEGLHQKALELNRELGNRKGEAASYSNLGDIAAERGDLAGAEQMHQKALELNQHLDHVEGIAANYQDLGTLARSRGDLATAERLLQQALELHRQLGIRSELAAIHLQLCLVTGDRGESAMAERMGQQASDLYEQLGDRIGIAFSSFFLSILAYDRKDLDTADHLSQRALAFLQQPASFQVTFFKHLVTSRELNEAISYMHLLQGDIHEDRGDHAEARQHAQRARELLVNLGSEADLKEVDALLARIPPSA